MCFSMLVHTVVDYFPFPSVPSYIHIVLSAGNIAETRIGRCFCFYSNKRYRVSQKEVDGDW